MRRDGDLTGVTPSAIVLDTYETGGTDTSSISTQPSPVDGLISTADSVLS